MPKHGIVNVRMVITEEKILSNIEKVQRLINPNSKKQIIELDDNSYFKDLVESIKTYLVEYPKKKNFPKSVYDAAYGLVEYATNQFEENTKQIEELIKHREKNIKLAAILKQTTALVESKDSEWKKSVQAIEKQFPQEIIEALQVLGRAKGNKSEHYQESLKLVNARIANLESNLHIEIDMERVEDRSKALSYIGIEIADALKLIPTPIDEAPKVENIVEEAPVETKAKSKAKQKVETKVKDEIQEEVQDVQEEQQPVQEPVQTVQYTQPIQQNEQQNVYNVPNIPVMQNVQNVPNMYNVQGMQNVQNMQMPNMQGMQNFVPQQFNYNNGNMMPQQQYYAQQNQQMVQPMMQNVQGYTIQTQPVQPVQAPVQIQLEKPKKAKSSLWNKLKNSKVVRAIKYALKIKVVLQLPEPIAEANSDNNNK